MQSAAAASVQPLLEKALPIVRDSGRFGACRVRDGMLECDCATSESEAFFRVFVDEGKVWAGMMTPDRWLSQSIEQDLVHTGDKLGDLLDEELVELGIEGQRPTFQHFRDEAKLFVFRTALPVEAGDSSDTAAEIAAKYLLAYEAALRPLGDMEASDDDE